MKQKTETSSTTGLSGCDHEMAIKEINRGHELTTQLRALLIPLLPAGVWSELAGDLFEEILKCSTMAVSGLQNGGSGAASDSDDDRRNKVFDQKRKSTDEVARPEGRKRRLAAYSNLISFLLLSWSSQFSV